MQLGQVTNVLERQESLIADSARVLTDGADTLNASANRQRKTASRANGSANILDSKSANNKKRNRGKNKRVKVKSHKQRIFESQPFLTPVRENLGSLFPTSATTPRDVNRSGRVRNTASDNCQTYRFGIGGASDLTVNLNGLTSAATVRIVRDVNNNGIVDKGDVIEASNNLNQNSKIFDLNRLATGDYFAQVYKVGAGETNYNLNLRVATAAAQDPTSTSSVQVKGNLNGLFSSGQNTVNATNNRTDDYLFRVDFRSTVNASLAGLNTQGARVRLFDSAGSEVAGSASGTATLERGSYFARVEKLDSGTTNYSLQLRGTPIEGNRVGVFVQRATAIDQFDNSFFEDSRADFYTKVKIDRFAERQSPTVVNNNNAPLNFTELKETALGQRFVDIDLKIFDDDGILPHEEANINPNTSQKSLKIRYDTATGNIRVDGVNATFQRGRAIELTGRGSGKKASVRFFVDHF